MTTSRIATPPRTRFGVAIETMVVSLYERAESGLLAAHFPDHVINTLRRPTLNVCMDLDPKEWRLAHDVLTSLLSNQFGQELRDNPTIVQRAPILQSDVSMRLPAKIGDYAGFYSSKSHATNVDTMFCCPDSSLALSSLHMVTADQCSPRTAL